MRASRVSERIQYHRTINHIHTVTRLIEVSREYKMPLCLTFIDLKKAFDTIETEAVLEALGNQGVPTQYIRIFRELYSNFTTRISPFYDDITIDVRRGVRQSDTVSPKLFTPTLEDVMRRLGWDNMGVRVDGRLLHHLRFVDDIVLITPSISQAERMLADFDDACGRIGLQLSLTKTMFMRNGLVPDAQLMHSSVLEPEYFPLVDGADECSAVECARPAKKPCEWYVLRTSTAPEHEPR
ncbi:hypothetical protein Y032_0187g1101 [Ancylostoma ceylanicum]|uniref:Reverse transcriptase domain-containing protein n=1 Tax=Ancylostoma ceylanicum TaxID=53326 RepID=A0A016SQK1_9BILA|nr:hypothetical protein Y032_0187g1101 [Ancylostoma ceylanicum]